MIVSAVTLLPEPDSPTIPSVWPRAQAERDAVDGGDGPVQDVEVGLQVADVEQGVAWRAAPRGAPGR